MRRGLATLSIIATLSLIFLVMACTSTPTPTPAPTAKPAAAAPTQAPAAATKAPAPAATPVPTKPAPITVRLSHTFPEDHNYSIGLNNWVKLVDAKTQGRLVVKVFPSSQLYKEDQELAAVRSGAVEMVGTRVSLMPTVDPVVDLFQLPMLFTDYIQASKFLNTPVMQNWYENKWNKELGLKFLAHNYLGGGAYFYDKKPINKVDDLKGMKMRMPPGKTNELTAKALGINGVVISINDTFTSLQQGMIDGVYTSAQAQLTRGFSDIAKYGNSYPNFMVQAGWILASSKWWSTLPADLQKAILEAGPPAEAFSVKLADEADNPTFDKLVKEKGNTLVRFSDEEVAKMKKILAPVYDEVAKPLDPAIVDALFKAVGVR